MIRSIKSKLFCTFIDFSGAFDSIWRADLWHKLLQIGIDGKCMQIVKNMYQNIKSRVKANGQQSAIFSSEIGVRQGENISPILFSLFLNDVERYLVMNNNNGITMDYRHEDANFYLQILVFHLC